MTWGLVRTTSTYTRGRRRDARRVRAPAHTLITRGGHGGRARRLLPHAASTPTATAASIRRAGACDGSSTAATPAAAAASADRVCVCIPSCPFCEDCPTQRLRAARVAVRSRDCGPDGSCKVLPYALRRRRRLRADRRHVHRASPSCPACDDCRLGLRAAVPSCEPIEIVRIDVYGPDRLVIGQDGSAQRHRVASPTAPAIDVTWLATWASSQPTVATVDGWGRIAALGRRHDRHHGRARRRRPARALALTVVERPTLRRIYAAERQLLLPDRRCARRHRRAPLPPTMATASSPPPSCQQVVRIGATLQFIAVGEFDTGYYEDITDEVDMARSSRPRSATWRTGLFTARAGRHRPADAPRSAAVDSDAVERHASSPRPPSSTLSIYPVDWALPHRSTAVPVARRQPMPCFECGYFLLTLLRGDTLRFAATAHYDTGEWEDVTAPVTWRSSDATRRVDRRQRRAHGGGRRRGVGRRDARRRDQRAAASCASSTRRHCSRSTPIQDGQDRVIGKGEQARVPRHRLLRRRLRSRRHRAGAVAQQRRDGRRLRQPRRLHRPQRRDRDGLGRARRPAERAAAASKSMRPASSTTAIRPTSTAAPGRTTSTASRSSPTAPSTRRPASSRCASR